MRCAILGGAGFLGRHIGRAMASEGAEVWSVDRSLSAAGSAPWLAGEVQADCFDLPSWWDVVGGADVIVHLASSTVPATASEDPIQDVQTNLVGTLRLLQELRKKAERPRLLFASSGGAVYGRPQYVPLCEAHPTMPMGAYGATKLASDKLFVAGNSYSGGHETRFAVVRYGNVMGSRGSVIPFFMSIKDQGVLPITDARMTRFMISLEEGVELVWHAFEDMEGGEIYVKKIPSMKVVDLAHAVVPEARHEFVGIRPGEKVHEQMIGSEDSFYTYEYPEHFKILPVINEWATCPKRIKDGQKVAEGFVYSSDNNAEWMSDEALQSWIEQNREKIGSI